MEQTKRRGREPSIKAKLKRHTTQARVKEPVH